MWYNIENYTINLSSVELIERTGKRINFYRVVRGKEETDGSGYTRYPTSYLKVFDFTFESEEIAQTKFTEINSFLCS